MGNLSARPRGNGRQPKVTIGVVSGAKASMNDISAVEVSMCEESVGLKTVRGELKPIRAPRAIIVIAEGWPSCLISILTLKLPLVGAYFPRRHHHHFKVPTNSRFDC